ncbi:MAG: tetratricopeptide repeat protein, partial [Endomicrobiales bacterium]
MKKYRYLIAVCLVIFPSICFSISRTELDEFNFIGVDYEQNTNKAIPLVDAQAFVKRYPDSQYVERVNYIIALCLGDTPEAISKYRHILQTFAMQKQYGMADMRVENYAIAVSAAYQIAQIYYRHHDYDEARRCFQILSSRFSHSFLEGECLYGLMQVQLAGNQWAEAETTLGKLMQTGLYYQKDQRVLYSAGLMLYNKNEFEEAYGKLQYVNSSEGLYYQAMCLSKLKKYLPAVTVFRRLLDDYSADHLREEVRYLIADCYYQAEDFDVALSEYNKFLIEFPHSVLAARAQYQKGFCSIRKKDFATAINVLQDLINKYPASTYAPLAQSLIAQALTEQRQYDAALSAYKVLISSYPNSYCVPEGYYKMGWCYFNEQKYPAAIASCKEMVKKFPTNELVPDALFLIGENDRRVMNLDESINCYEQIVRSTAATPAKIESALFMLTKTYSEQKRYKDVVSTYHYIVNNFAADSSSWRPFTLLRIAEAYYYLGIYPEAEKIYNTIIERYPFTRAANLAVEGKSWVYFQLKEYDLAKNERQ